MITQAIRAMSTLLPGKILNWEQENQGPLRYTTGKSGGAKELEEGMTTFSDHPLHKQNDDIADLLKKFSGGGNKKRGELNKIIAVEEGFVSKLSGTGTTTWHHQDAPDGETTTKPFQWPIPKKALTHMLLSGLEVIKKLMRTCDHYPTPHPCTC